MIIRESSPRGLTLLEVLVAMALLGIFAAASTAIVQQGMQSIGTMRDREAEISAAEFELNRMAVWRVAELQMHQGPRRIGALVVNVIERSSTLYDVIVSDSTGRRVIMATSFYRRQTGAPATP